MCDTNTKIQHFQAFFCIALVSAASAAPQLLAGHLGHGVVAGGQRSHQSVSKPFQGEVRTTSQAKSFGSPIASVASSDSVSNTAQSGLASHLGQGAVVGGLAHGVVGHGLAHEKCMSTYFELIDVRIELLKMNNLFMT